MQQPTWGNNTWLRALLTGGLIGVAFLHPLLWWTVFLGGCLFFRETSRVLNYRNAALAGWLVGVVKSLIVLVWFWSSYPMDWMGLSGPLLQLSLICLYWIPAALTIGSGYALLGVVVWSARHLAVWKQVTLVASAWVVADVLGALVFSLYTLGPGSFLNTAFSFGFFGYPLAVHSWLVQAAQLGGVYALTFLAGVIVVVLSHAVAHRKFFIIGGAGLLVLILSFSSPFAQSDQSPSVGTVAVVNTSFDKDISRRGVDARTRAFALYQATQHIASSSVTHVVFPEDVRYQEMLPLTIFDSGYNERFGNDVVVVDTGRVDTATSTALRAFVTDASGVTTEYDKQYLVPQGEYVPYVYQLLMRVAGMNDRLEDVVAGTNYIPGKPYTPAAAVENMPKVLFCFESVNPRGVYTLMQQSETPPPFIAHVVSHAWFNNEPEMLWHQLDLMLTTQAVWNQVPIVQAANETANKIYWPSGHHNVLPLDVAEELWGLSFVEL